MQSEDSLIPPVDASVNSAQLPSQCACGLKSGDYIALVSPLEVRDHNDKVTRIIPADAPWKVLGPEPEDGIVWLLDPHGKRHTWDDDADDIFSYFRRVAVDDTGSAQTTPT